MVGGKAKAELGRTLITSLIDGFWKGYFSPSLFS